MPQAIVNRPRVVGKAAHSATSAPLVKSPRKWGPRPLLIAGRRDATVHRTLRLPDVALTAPSINAIHEVSRELLTLSRRANEFHAGAAAVCPHDTAGAH